jgi:ankyrin repeat protein
MAACLGARILLLVLAQAETPPETIDAAARTRVGSLLDAVNADDAAGVRAALARGAQLDERHAGGQTALMGACLGGKPAAAHALIVAGADVTLGEQDGYTCAHGVGFQGRAELVPVLLVAGIKLDERHSDGFAPMHRACWGVSERHTRTVEAFLKAGVPFDLAAADGTRPMQMAASNRATVAVLLAARAAAAEGAAAKGEL